MQGAELLLSYGGLVLATTIANPNPNPTPYQVLSYGGLVLATALGVALHPQRATILDSLSQVSWT